MSGIDTQQGELDAVLLIGLAISFWLRQDRRPSRVATQLNNRAED